MKKLLNILNHFENTFFNLFFTKYVIDYMIIDDHIKIISNTGKYRLVKNTKSNLRKINQVIVKNKIIIANRIDAYEDHAQERLMIFIINICLVIGSGLLIPLTFFTGIYTFFILAIFAFSICVITVLTRSFDYYILIKEIQSLKNLTGYKKEKNITLSEYKVNL